MRRCLSTAMVVIAALIFSASASPVAASTQSRAGSRAGRPAPAVASLLGPGTPVSPAIGPATPTRLPSAAAAAVTVTVPWSARVPSVSGTIYGARPRARTVCPNGAVSVTVRTRQLWSPSLASMYLVDCHVVVTRAGQLVLAPGTVVEVGGNGASIYVAPGGSLVAGGTAAHPVVFTSLPDEGYSQVVMMDGRASVRLSHAIFRLGSSGVGASAIIAADPLVISGCAAEGGDTLVINASELSGPVTLGQCDSRTLASHFWLTGNRFDGAADFSLAGNPVDTLHLSSNSFNLDAGTQPSVAITTNNVPIQGVDLSGRGANVFSARARPVTVSLQNAVVSPGTSWAFSSSHGASLMGQVTVDGSASLAPGAILSGTALTVGPRGSLRAKGTAQQPVRFAAGSAIEVTGGGSLVVDHAVFSGSDANDLYENGCTTAGDESVTVENSTFQGVVSSLGNCDSKGKEDFAFRDNLFRSLSDITALGFTVPGLAGPENPHPGRLVVTGNVFRPRPGPRPSTPLPEVAVYGWPVQGLALAGPDANRFWGEGASRVVDLSDSQVPAGSSWDVSPVGREVLETQTDYFDKPGIVVTGRLIVSAGSIVKVGITRALAGGIGVGFGIALGNRGTLDVRGTADRPVIVTSMANDKVGGESYGLKTTPSQQDYQNAVSGAEGSHVDISHAAFSDGWYAFQADCAPKPRDGGTFLLAHSSVNDEVSLGDCDGSQHGYTPRLEANVFDFKGAASSNFAAGGGYDPTAYQPAVLLYNIDPTGVDLAGSGSNLFKGQGAGRVVALAGTTVPKAKTWTVSRGSGAVLAPWPDTDYLTSPGVTVEGTLDLGPGTAVKSAISGVGIDVQSLGNLHAVGTKAHPDVFTAIADDSIDGDSNGDGKASSPKPGAYGIAVQFENIDNGSALDNDVFAFATDAINVQLLDRFTVTSSDFVDNVDAYDVEGTTTNDPVLARLPCVPPYLSSMASQGDWYGPHGFPAPNIDLGAFGGVVVPSLFAQVFTYLTTEIDESVNLFGGPNTIPWSIFSCPPALIVAFPITPVDINAIPKGPNFPNVDPPYVPIS